MEIAIGLWRHQGTQELGLLERFAEYVGALTYGDVDSAESWPTEEMLSKMLRQATRIHVNLDGLVETFEEMPPYYRIGQFGYQQSAKRSWEHHELGSLANPSGTGLARPDAVLFEWEGDQLMKLTFVLPPRSVASSLKSIAKHVPALTLISLPPLPGGTFEVSRQDRQIQWQTAADAVTFELDSVTEMEIAPVENNGVEFVSIVLTFQVPGRTLAYLFVTSNAAETEWLVQTAKDLGDLFGMPVQNRLQPQTASH
jgi:hypothetical protein